ncbi:rRNA maturation RNase YbeY [Patescibacteria group bacterium]|nr:rRNA maturation RNase YbeY [Patescibacteria group bacterium]
MVEINNLWGKNVPEEVLKKAAFLTLQTELGEKEKEISITLVSDNKIRQLNRKFHKVDSFTDVLAFPMEDDFVSTKDILGDVVISPEVALRQAKKHSFEDELALLVIHGVLHLLGYRDEKKKMREMMENRERRILKQMGINEKII